MTRHRLLLVEDSPTDRLLIADALAGDPQAEYEIVAVDRLALALAHLKAGGVDVVLLDLDLPDSSGEDTYRKARAAAPDLPIVVCTGSDEEALGLRLLREGADELLLKDTQGTGGEDLRRVVRYGIERAAARRRMQALVTLVGGVAHEITNPTHGILLSAQLLGKAWQDLQPLLDAYFQDNPQTRVGNVSYSQVRVWIPEVIADIQTGAERIKSVVAALREYAREERAPVTGSEKG
jgi:CheY-like chemotaxis protein